MKLYHNVLTCQDYFYMNWSAIYSGYNCPICSGHQVGRRTCLAYLYPDLAKEWHPDNEESPEEVTYGSKKRIYWICPKCSYGENKEWCISPNSRTKAKSGCPACAGKVVTDRNRLSIIFPKVSSEWDYDKNKDTPNDVSLGTHKKRWWICVNGHSYLSSINDRTSGYGCPACSGRVVSDSNRLSILYPEICEEWDYDKNYDTPNDISYGKPEKRWWICSNGHSYFSSVVHRTKGGRGCPTCSNSKGEDKVSSWIDENESKLRDIGIIACIQEKSFPECRNKNPLPFDFGFEYRNSSWSTIEYHGPHHYKPIRFSYSISENQAKENLKTQKKRDKIKEKYCKKNNVPFLIIPYWEFDNIEKILEQTFFG